MAVYIGELIVGGNFTTAGGMEANYIARWDGTAWSPLGSGMGGFPAPLLSVYTLTEYNGELIAGGWFTTAGGQVSAYWARWGCPCPADCDQNRILDIFDFLCFQNSFVLGEPYACDCDPDPLCDIFDFLCFQNAFVAGCP
ncbi:MAG: hypothetical protein IIB55_00825 [Planctomycetes bacterium]|nr:hypothetical protein [Planctomycetota bacterium]